MLVHGNPIGGYIFYFVGASGTNVIQEFFSAYYTFSHAFAGADLVFDLDVNYANNNPLVDSTNATSLIATHRNMTLNPWVKIAYRAKRHFLALGYAYNYDFDTSTTGYSEVILLATIYY